jgi:RNA recognition motif-containing protein
MHKIDDTVYINNLPQDVTEDKLAAHFGSIGIIKMDKKTRKPKSKNNKSISFPIFLHNPPV